MFYGANTEELRAHADALSTAGNRCLSLFDGIAASVASTEWTGPDAVCFRAAVTTAVSTLGEPTAEMLLAGSQQLLDHVDEQDEASRAAGPGDSGADRDLREEGRGGDPRRGRRPHDAQDQEPGSPEFGTPGPDAYPGGLGPGSDGTTADVPDPPAWTPPDGGSGEYDQREPTLEDYANYELAELIAAGGDLTGKGPAADNMRHFLGNTGDDMPIDVDDMMANSPGLSAEIDATRQQLGQQAIAEAESSGATGPVTFPVNTDWSGYYITQSESEKYFYATGGMEYNINGTVTAHPPSTPGGEWTYEMSTEVNSRDRYNWDTGKGVTIGPVTVQDEQMQGLHQSGLAQEYNIIGQSSEQTTTGP